MRRKYSHVIVVISSLHVDLCHRCGGKAIPSGGKWRYDCGVPHLTGSNELANGLFAEDDAHLR